MYFSTTSFGGSTPFSTGLALGFGVLEGWRAVVAPSAVDTIATGALDVSSGFAGLLFGFELLLATAGTSLLAPGSAP